MKRSFLKSFLFAAFALLAFSSCSDDTNTTPQTEPKYDMTGFAKGADISWLTEMEASGKKFYNAKGSEQDCCSATSAPTRCASAYGWTPQTDGQASRTCS